MPAPSAKDELKNLILQALRRSYVSESCCDKIPTGNHYQSVKLGDERTAGFRSDRQEFFDQIDFAGKRVLDLGSNLGEMSRSARERGASQVDGFEYDPFFVDIANMVNAYNDVARVAFYKRDITDPTIYDEHYDIVCCFSAFTYVTRVLEQVAAITDEVFILETHRLTDNLTSDYLKPLSRYFPYYAILGDSDWGSSQDTNERRVILAFAREEAMLEATLGSRVGIQYAPDGVPAVDDPRRAIESAPVLPLDLERTTWYDRFFSTFTFETPDALLAAIGRMDVDVDALADSRDSRILEYGGWVYWLMFVRGYLQSVETGSIAPENVYHRYMTDYFLPRKRDPGLNEEMATPALVMERIALRFRDFAALHDRRDGAFAGEDAIPLPQILLGNPASEDALTIIARGEERPRVARFVDGHHRIFAAKLLGMHTLPCKVVAEDPAPPFLRGVIERFAFDGERIQLDGWGMRPNGPITLFEVRSGAKTLTSAGVTPRPDVAAAFPNIPEAAGSGFAIDHTYRPTSGRAYRLAGRPFVAFDVIARNELLAVGRMSVCYVPGMFDERNWPPPALTERLLGEQRPARLATRAATVLYQMVEPLTRYRAPSSFRQVLDWGCGCGLLETFAPHFLPEATITGIDGDAEAIAWCQLSGLPGTFIQTDAAPPTDLPAATYDLILSYGMMPSLDRDEQRAWLAEMHRVARPGGYVVLAVNGETMRQFHASPRVRDELARDGIANAAPRDPETQEARGRTMYQTEAYARSAYAEWFAVVEYIAGAIEGQRDLILLRKR